MSLVDVELRDDSVGIATKHPETEMAVPVVNAGFLARKVE